MATILPFLSDLGYDINVISLGPDGPMSEPIREAGINIFQVSPQGRFNIPKLRGIYAILKQLSEVRSIVKDISPDILHCFLGMPSIIGALTYKKSPKCNLIISKRNQLSRPDSFYKEGVVELIAMKMAKVVMAHSSVVRDELINAGIDAKKLRIVHNGINKLPYELARIRRQELRIHYGWAQEVVFVMLANLIPYKGHSFLFDALERLQSCEFGNAPWRVVLVGTGQSEYEAFLRERVRQANLSAKVSFLGRREDTAEILAASDVGLLLSDHEGFSNAVLEYMASGLPTIATAVGGNIDAVKDGLSGKLIKARDACGLEEAIRYFFINEVDRISIGSEAKLFLEDRFSLRMCVEGYDQVYSELLQ
ncbi:MAG: glycosyltransferase [Thalassospira sp.]|nr:glycosyltransferase [Thalassospira sp.]